MSAANSLISIVVPSYNQASWLRECLESLINQQDPSTEIIVIDGGSSDQSVEIIQQYAHRLAYWESEGDRGQSHALNKGLAKAQGDWLGWLNSDDLLLPGALGAFRQAMEKQPQGDWFAGGGRFVDERSQVIKRYNPPSRPLRASDLSPWTHHWFAQPGCFFTRNLYKLAGGYIREDLRYAMDLDLWLRLGKEAILYPIDFPMGAYRLQGESKTVAERPAMEVEVARVLAENLGLESALARVEGLAREKFELEFRYRRLTDELRSPLGWWRLVKRRMSS